jgi:hypothetical protein
MSTNLPFLGRAVVAYIPYAWHLMDRVKITEDEITSSGEHHY